MKVDLTEMLLFFDEPMSPTDEEMGTYWFKTRKTNGLSMTFAFSLYEKYVDIIIRGLDQDIASLSLKECSEIRVLDLERKCLEVLHSNGDGRCFVSLLEGAILSYEG